MASSSSSSLIPDKSTNDQHSLNGTIEKRPLEYREWVVDGHRFFADDGTVFAVLKIFREAEECAKLVDDYMESSSSSSSSSSRKRCRDDDEPTEEVKHSPPFTTEASCSSSSSSRVKPLESLARIENIPIDQVTIMSGYAFEWLLIWSHHKLIQYFAKDGKVLVPFFEEYKDTPFNQANKMVFPAHEIEKPTDLPKDDPHHPHSKFLEIYSAALETGADL